MESNMVTSLIPYLNFWRLRSTRYVFSTLKVQPQPVHGAVVVEKVREVEPQQPRVLVPLHKFPPVVHSLVLAQEGLELAPPEIGLLWFRTGSILILMTYGLVFFKSCVHKLILSLSWN